MEEPEELTFQFLREITDGFSEERKVGEGGFGTVYKGVTKTGEDVAVKIFRDGNPDLDHRQFRNEFYNLMKVKHNNIVQVLGYCYEIERTCIQYDERTVLAEKAHRALCFEYLHKGSLQKYLSDDFCQLDWHTWYRIIKGTCEGLKYIHKDLGESLLHLDLKPDNILVDKNMVPEIADFGLSKIFGDELTRTTQSPLGTLGYQPPEYIESGVISEKFDIFSLGIVIIMIVSGPNGYSKYLDTPDDFIDQVQRNWREKWQETCSSGFLLEACCLQVKTCTEIALGCLEKDSQKRPDIVEIINKLNEIESYITEEHVPSLNDLSDENASSVELIPGEDETATLTDANDVEKVAPSMSPTSVGGIDSPNAEEMLVVDGIDPTGQSVVLEGNGDPLLDDNKPIMCSIPDKQTENISSVPQYVSFERQQHRKPKKPDMIAVTSQDYVCDEQDRDLIDSILDFDDKKIVVRIGESFVDMAHFKCLLQPNEFIWGDVLNAYINCIRAEKHLLCRNGQTVYLEDSLTSELHHRYGKYMNNFRPDKRTDTIVERLSKYIRHDMVFFPINVRDTHWYLMVINGTKREIQILDSLPYFGRTEFDFTLQGLKIQFEKYAADIETTGMKWPDLLIHLWPVTDVFKKPMQTDR